MNKFSCGLLISLIVVLVGCGGLSRSINYNGLSREDIDYIENMENPSTSNNFSIKTTEGEFVANKFQYSYLALPVFYMEAVGKGSYNNAFLVENAYGATKFICLGPLVTYKARLFSLKGEPIGGMSSVGVPVLFGYQSLDLRGDSTWRFNFVNVPLTDISLIGFGTKYFKLLFISYDPLRWNQ